MRVSPNRLGLAIVATWLAVPSAALAATITVTSTVDSLVTNGSCSIREAIINANNDAATWPDCAAGSGADVINLPGGTILFAIANTPGPPDQPANGDTDHVAAKGDLDILSSMTINGHSSGTTIDGNQLDRIFDINPDVDSLPETVTPVITVHVNDLTMTNARQNQSGAVRIFPRATVTIDRSTVSNSESWADDGGGIYVFGDGAFPPQHGTLTLTNSTISGNHALIMGGGIRSDGVLSIVNSTITDNDTGGVFGNLAQGLMCGTVCTLRNSIVAGNGAAPRGDIGGTITSLGYNIIGKTTNNNGDVIAIITATTGDQFNTGIAPVMLGALASNGGPTLTHELGAGSIAIDQGESSAASTDQRGETRPCDLAAVTNAAGGDGADIGSFEVQGVCFSNSPPDAVDDSATIEVNSGANTIDVLANDSDPDVDPLTITAVTQGASGGVVSTDGSSISYTPGLNFLGTDTFTYTIDDGHGETDTATVTVTVEDTTPPQLTASIAAASLWPPNHQLESVGLTVVASDNGGGAVTTAVSVFSDEDDLAPGSGNFSPDAKNIAPLTLRLRAERSGAGDGRVYMISLLATDSSSNTSASCLTVVVPHSNSPQDTAAVAAQAAAAKASCEANGGAAPAGYVVVGDGPIVGPKQ
jgi:CSLREA domain-containing protein